MNDEIEMFLTKWSRLLGEIEDDPIKEFTKIAMNEKAEISAKKDGDGITTATTGRGPAVLVTLISLKRTILKDMNIPDELFEMIEKTVDIEESE